jgi:hypothetical protein
VYIISSGRFRIFKIQKRMPRPASASFLLFALFNAATAYTFRANGFRSVLVCGGGPGQRLLAGSIVDFGAGRQQLALKSDGVFLSSSSGCVIVETYCLQSSRGVPFLSNGHLVPGERFPVEKYRDQGEVWRASGNYRSAQAESFRNEARQSLTLGASRQAMGHVFGGSDGEIDAVEFLLVMEFLWAIILVAVFIAVIVLILYALKNGVEQIALEPYVEAAESLRRKVESVQTIQTQVITTVETTFVQPAAAIADVALGAAGEWLVFAVVITCVAVLVLASCTQTNDRRAALAIGLAAVSGLLEMLVSSASSGEGSGGSLTKAVGLISASIFATTCTKTLVASIRSLRRWIPSKYLNAASAAAGALAVGSAANFAPHPPDVHQAACIFGIAIVMARMSLWILDGLLSLINVVAEAIVHFLLPAGLLVVALSKFLAPLCLLLPESAQSSLVSFGVGTNYWDILLHNPANLLNIYELQRFNAGWGWPVVAILLCSMPRIICFWLYTSKVTLATFLRAYASAVTNFFLAQLIWPLKIALMVYFSGVSTVLTDFVKSNLVTCVQATLGFVPAHFVSYVILELVWHGGERIANSTITRGNAGTSATPQRTRSNSGRAGRAGSPRRRS